MYCSNCKKETEHKLTSKPTDKNKCYKCLKCGYDKLIVQGFNYDLM